LPAAKKIRKEARADSSPDPSSARTKSEFPPNFKKESVGVLRNPFPRKLFSQNLVRIEVPPHCPNTWRAEHQRKMSFPFLEEISRAQIRNARNIFLWCPPRLCEAGGGAFVSYEFL